MSSFVEHTVLTAPEAARPALAATAKKLGYLPAAMARMAESPSVVAAFGRLMAIWEGCSLGPVEREVVTFVIAARASCEVCVAMHSAIVTRLVPGDAALLTALREDRALDDGRLDALRTFTRAVLDSHGGVSNDQLASLLAQGFTREQALDVVLGVGLYTLSTSANRLTRAPLDAPLAAFAWRAPG